jgi:inositol 1,4,5-triphosphate receptor type 1
MVAEGSFAEANPVIEDVHCRMRRIDVKKQARLPSTSSYTYWQIEKQVDSRRGEGDNQYERCHFDIFIR